MTCLFLGAMLKAAKCAALECGIARIGPVNLEIYSKKTWTIRVGRNWDHNGYGYRWWSIRAGDYRYNLAWGHGGQQIVLLDDLERMIVFLADPLHLQHGDGPWRIEKANLNLVADFVAALPGE